MPKNTIQDIAALGFVFSMYKTNETEFAPFVQGVIEEQSILLKGRIGETIYNSSVSPSQDYVKRAEKCLAAAEMVQRRINIIIGSVTGSSHDIDISHEAAQKKAYLDEAERWISKLTANVTSDPSDFSFCTAVTPET